MYKKKDPGNRDNFVLLPGPVSQSDLNNANSQNPLVRRVNALFRVRLRMSVVVASRRCERLTQEYWCQYRIPKSSIKNFKTLTTQQRVPAHPAKFHSRKFLSSHNSLHRIFPKTISSKIFPGTFPKHLSGTRNERPVRNFPKMPHRTFREDSCIQSPRHAADPEYTSILALSF